jgi:hypothetical protein
MPHDRRAYFLEVVADYLDQGYEDPFTQLTGALAGLEPGDIIQARKDLSNSARLVAQTLQTLAPVG